MSLRMAQIFVFARLILKLCIQFTDVIIMDQKDVSFETKLSLNI